MQIQTPSRVCLLFLQVGKILSTIKNRKFGQFAAGALARARRRWVREAPHFVRRSALAYYLVVLREDLLLSLLENILKASRELSEIDCRRQKQKFYLLTWSL